MRHQQEPWWQSIWVLQIKFVLPTDYRAHTSAEDLFGVVSEIEAKGFIPTRKRVVFCHHVQLNIGRSQFDWKNETEFVEEN